LTARVGVDTGGTFTDLIAWEDGRFTIAKTLSTPDAPSTATATALEQASLQQPGAVSVLVHGTTIATNAIVERRGPRVGLLTTAGFRDLLDVERHGRPDSFSLEWTKPPHIVQRDSVREVTERVDANGKVVVSLDEDTVRVAIRDLAAHGAEVIAVCYLFSYLNPQHELRTRELIVEELPGTAVSLSHEVFPQWREYVRASTTVFDAFLKPVVHRYAVELEALTSRHGIGELLIMRSNGGVMTPLSARELPISMVRSGPAGGVIASLAVGALTGDKNLIIGDMGGTSFDTCLISGGQPLLTDREEVEFGIPIGVPMVDVRSIGAGGGSIAWADGAGLVQVGPRSAGAVPGPVCYGGGGTEPTVTDANLVLGRLSQDQPLAGTVRLDGAAARKSLEPIAAALGRSVEEAALGVIAIADNNMAQALKLVSIDRGVDPREFTLMAFGGAGPLHATSLARALGIGRVIVPVQPGVFCALGALLADTRFDFVRTGTARGGADLAAAREAFETMGHNARRVLAREHAAGEMTAIRSVDMRYAGQNWELEVTLPGEVDDADLSRGIAAFHDLHLKRFGWNDPEGAVEFVNFRLTALVPRPAPDFPRLAPGPMPDPVGRREVIFTGRTATVPVYRREDLPAAATVDGPAIIAEFDSTVLLHPGDEATVDDYGNLIIQPGPAGRTTSEDA
jgi:N-methylhydantoinase A